MESGKELPSESTKSSVKSSKHLGHSNSGKEVLEKFFDSLLKNKKVCTYSFTGIGYVKCIHSIFGETNCSGVLVQACTVKMKTHQSQRSLRTTEQTTYRSLQRRSEWLSLFVLSQSNHTSNMVIVVCMYVHP